MAYFPCCIAHKSELGSRLRPTDPSVAKHKLEGHSVERIYL